MNNNDGLTIDLSDTPIRSLPDNLLVKGWLFVENTDIVNLPKNLYVQNSLYIRDTKIETLPDDIVINGNLFCVRTPLFEKYDRDFIKKNGKLRQERNKKNVYHEW